MEIFTLNSSKINEILYSMENQEKDSYINIQSGEIEFFDKGTIKELEDDLYVLPEWGPIQGFRIMDDFTGTLKNPLVKQELKSVLNSGHGVFRKFKNVIKENQEVQKLWYQYKKNEMKTLVITWYNQLRELIGLDVLTDDEFEDEQELLGFDFTIETGDKDSMDFIIGSDKKGFSELYNMYPNDVIDELYERKREGIVLNDILDQDYIFVAKSPTGETTGYIWFIEYVLGESFKVIELMQLYVDPTFRGLGLGKLLLEKILLKFKENSADEILINNNKNSWIVKYIENNNFNLSTQELSFRS